MTESAGGSPTALVRKRRAVDDISLRLQKRLRFTPVFPVHPLMHLLKRICGWTENAPAWICVQYMAELETDDFGFAFFATFSLQPRATLSQYQQSVLWRHLGRNTASVDRFDWDVTRGLLLAEPATSRRLVRAVRELEGTTSPWFTFRLWRAPLCLLEHATFYVWRLGDDQTQCSHFTLNLLAPEYFAAQAGGGGNMTWPLDKPTMFHGCHTRRPVELPQELSTVLHAPTPRLSSDDEDVEAEEAEGLAVDFQSCCRVRRDCFP